MNKLKLSLVIALLGVVSLVGAQNLSYNVRGGLNMSNMSGDLSDTKMKPGFHIGVGVDYEFAPNIALQSGLFFSNKGAKIEGDASIDEIEIVSGEATMNANFLQLPIHIAYKINVTPGTKVVLHAGPYIAYGVGGKTKFEASTGGLNVSEKIDTFGSDGLKEFDSGLGIGVGAEFGSILIDLGWDMGLVNLGNNDVDAKTQNAYLSVGYIF